MSGRGRGKETGGRGVETRPPGPPLSQPPGIDIDSFYSSLAVSSVSSYPGAGNKTLIHGPGDVWRRAGTPEKKVYTTFDLYNIWFISTIKLNEFFRFYRMNILKFNITAESLRVSLASGQKQRV